MLVVPRYGTASLADVMPALLAGLRVPGEEDRIGLDLGGVRRICLLLVDGLGAEALAEHPGEAPFLSGLAGLTLTAGFPSTTAASLGSLGTGRPPGEHGIVGYLLAVPGQDRVMNTLQWRLHGPGPTVDLLSEVVPEQFQPASTAFERAAADGWASAGWARRTRAVRTDPRRAARRAVPCQPFGRRPGRRSRNDASRGRAVLAYAYHGDLDLTGHLRGPDTDAWRLDLANVDRLAAAIAARLPADGALVVTADHGMVEVTARIDLDTAPDLLDGVRLVGGEPRARHIYAHAGAAADVLATWRGSLMQDGFDVLPRDEAIESGWFGPTVSARARRMIGDLVAVARGSGGLIRRGAEPLQSSLIGHHGSLTSREMMVPLLVSRP